MIQLPDITQALSGQFVQGGMVLMVLGALLAYARALPSRAWRFLKSRFSVSLDIRSDDEVAFNWINVWLDTQPSVQQIRRLRLSSAPTKEGSRAVFTPAFGWFWIWWDRRLILLYREREEQDKSSGGFGNRRTELIQLHTWGRSPALLRGLVEEARQLAERQERGDPVIMVQYYDSWTQLGVLRDRPLESVVLPDDMAQECYRDLMQFIKSESWYHAHGVPWRRGYLLKGLPGAGKTSLVQAVAAAAGRDLYVLNLKSTGMTDERFLGLLAGIHKGVLLIEEVDLVVPSRETATSGSDIPRGVGLSTLLNVLDGAMSREGIPVFMTTNYPEKLDAALVRRGRVDREYTFTYATPEQLERLWCRFHPTQADRAKDFVALFPAPVAMADAQERLVATRENPETLWST